MNTFTPADFDFTLLDDGFCIDDIVEQKINELSESEDKDAFYVADLGDLLKKHLRWVRAMPRVMPFYAVNCNSSRAVVMTLASLGTGFDCVSKSEIQLVKSLGVDPSRIIYANPCKQASYIKYASEQGVQMMTFDSVEELVKVARCHKNAKMVVRIKTDDSLAADALSVKFGAPVKDCLPLMRLARHWGVDVIGVSFHVGCGCRDPKIYIKAISDARRVFDMGAEVGYNMTLLDIGGGFPGSDDSKLKFEEFTAVINPALDKYFPADSGVRVIAEPGRYYPTSAYTLAVNIISKKVVFEPVKKLPLGMEHVAFDDRTNKSGSSLMYYVNDGIHGSFNQVYFDPHHAMHTLHKKHQQDILKYPCSIWGPTCDKDDCIAKECIMPDLPTGEWLVFNNMGAYTISMYSNFNGFEDPIIHSVMSRTAWERIQQISAEGLPATVE